jgi:hypothetical protein
LELIDRGSRFTSTLNSAGRYTMEVHPADSAQVDPPMTQADSPTSGSQKARLMVEVNGRLRQLAETLAASEPIAFFCECTRPSCYAVVWLSSAAFDAMAAERAGWLIVAGHEPTEPYEPRERRAAPRVVVAPVMLAAPDVLRLPESFSAAGAGARPPAGRRWNSGLRQRLARSA